MGEHDLDFRVLDNVLELGQRVRDAKWNGNASCPPDAPLSFHVREPRRGQEGDAALSEVLHPTEQHGRDLRGSIE
jgi:hypothetical protein